MKRLVLVILAIMMLGMAGCGDPTIAVVIPVAPVINPPSITLNQFITKDPVKEIIYGSVDFYAPDADISTMTVTVFDSRGSIKTSTTTSLTLLGVTQGNIPFSIDYFNYPAGKFTFGIYFTDLNGDTSNQVAGTFLVP